jgi:hypothetical protein
MMVINFNPISDIYARYNEYIRSVKSNALHGCCCPGNTPKEILWIEEIS